jgi:plasmid stabilization system protein ParE
LDYQLLYTQRALNDLAEILGFAAQDDADAASRFGASLLDHVDLLARFPRLGSVVGKRWQVRKLLHGPLLVYYRLNEGKRRVEILHFRRGARKRVGGFPKPR